MDVAANTLSTTCYSMYSPDEATEHMQEDFRTAFSHSLPDYSEDSNFTIDIEFLACDAYNGLLSVHVTEHFTNIDGKVGTIEDTKTILMEEEPISAAVTVQYWIEDTFAWEHQLPTLYKSFYQSSGEHFQVPEDPTVSGLTFLGWTDEHQHLYSPQELQNLTCNNSKTFTATYQ